MFLLQMVLHEMGTRCSVNSTSLDYKTVETRVKHEGLSFLTITLPALAKDLERGISLGKVDHTLFTGFQLKGSTPLFLGGFFDLVFNRETGVLLDEPRHDAVFAIRQISLMFAKISLEPSARKVRKALRQYVEIDANIPQTLEVIDPAEWQGFLDSVVSYGHVFSLPSIERSTQVSSYLGMGQAPLLIGLQEIASTNCSSGLTAWNLCFLMECTRFRTTAGSIHQILREEELTSNRLSWWSISGPELSYLFG